MKQSTETNHWLIYELSPAEFNQALGIPPNVRIVTVSTVGEMIKIHAKEN